MRNQVESIWTEQRIADLKQFWGEGYSCSQIAAKMGCGITRNAVIGKVFRLDLERRSAGNGYLRIVDPIAPGATRKSVYKARERMPRRETGRTPPKVIAAISPITGAFINFKRPRLKREFTKNELRAMLTAAVQNTAAMEVIQ